MRRSRLGADKATVLCRLSPLAGRVAGLIGENFGVTIRVINPNPVRVKVRSFAFGKRLVFVWAGGNARMAACSRRDDCKRGYGVGAVSAT